VKEIRRQTKGGAVLVKFRLRIVSGKPVRSGKKRIRPTLADRFQAVEWLADRVFGVPVPATELVELERRSTFIDARSIPTGEGLSIPPH
jgi:hypothetical protein